MRIDQQAVDRKTRDELWANWLVGARKAEGWGQEQSLAIDVGAADKTSV